MTDQPDYAGVPVPPESFLSEIRQGGNRTLTEDFIACAAWGANEQFWRCVTYLEDRCLDGVAEDMRQALRPETVSLKEQALESFRVMHDHPVYMLTDSAKHIDIIRRALEALPD
jgi:hypothetical protein